MITTKFRFIWPSGFRGEDILKSANQKQESSVAAMFVNGWDKCALFIEDFPKMLPTKFQFIWLRGFRGEDLNVKS
jgi:hypothetical protein